MLYCIVKRTKKIIQILIIILDYLSDIDTETLRLRYSFSLILYKFIEII